MKLSKYKITYYKHSLIAERKVLKLEKLIFCKNSKLRMWLRKLIKSLSTAKIELGK